jgi:adenylate cyclase
LATERVERRLAAILAADVAGYSHLMSADEESVYVLLAVIRHHIKIGTIPGI